MFRPILVTLLACVLAGAFLYAGSLIGRGPTAAGRYLVAYHWAAPSASPLTAGPSGPGHLLVTLPATWTITELQRDVAHACQKDQGYDAPCTIVLLPPWRLPAGVSP